MWKGGIGCGLLCMGQVMGGRVCGIGLGPSYADAI